MKPRGTCDQRSRGRQKLKRQKPHSTSAANDDHPELDQAIADWIGKSDYSSTDIDQFIRSTNHFDSEFKIHQRLRKLAITLESESVSWEVLEGIYQRAQEQCPRDDLEVLDSLVVSATLYGESADNKNQQNHFFRIAYGHLDTLLQKAPDSARFHYLKAILYYKDPNKTVDQTLQMLADCLTIEPKHSWAKLYQAHCFHDQNNWQEAYHSYNEVNPAEFVGTQIWRYELLLEQKAYCAYQFDHNLGATEYLSLLERWENDPSILKHVWGKEYIQLARNELRELLYDRSVELFIRFKAISDSFCFDFLAELTQ